jgi:hypothetical protein
MKETYKNKLQSLINFFGFNDDDDDDIFNFSKIAYAGLIAIKGKEDLYNVENDKWKQIKNRIS